MTLDKVKTLDQFIGVVSKLYGKRAAIKIRPRFRAISWSYEDLFRNSIFISQLLEKEKIKKDDKILLWAPNSHLWIASFFGIQLKGAVVVPINIQNREEFVKKIAKQTNPKLLIKSIRFGEIESIKNINLETFSFHPTDFQKLTQVKINEDDLAEIVYTSGTTGDPKGVMLTHKNILSNVKASLQAIPVSQDDRFLSILPLSHMFEQIAGMLVPLASGAQITYTTSFNSISIRKNLIDDKITKMIAVPEFLKLIIRRIENEAEDKNKKELLDLLFKISNSIPSMKLRRSIFFPIVKKFGELDSIASGGASLEKEIGKKWEAMGIYILQGYGTTETSPVISANRYEDRKVDSVGKLLDGVKVKISRDGEILVKGSNVTPGYFKNPIKTRESFINGWYRTGDAGYFDEDDHLYIRGRTKYMIVTESGQNVYPEDIEFELNKMPNVEDSCVIGWRRGNNLEIHAVLLGKKMKNPEKIIEEVNKKLTSYQRIQSYSMWSLDDFPRTVTRKIKKDEVLSYLEKTSKESKTEKKTKDFSFVEKIISQVSGVNIKNISDNKRLVADLKMDSLQRVELTSLIEEETGIIIDESQIGPRTTVLDIKKKVENKQQKQEKYELKEWPLSNSIIQLRDVSQRLIVNPLLSFYVPFEKIEGLENLENLELPTIFLANHLSSLDAPIILKSIPSKIRKKIAVATASDVIYEQFKQYAGFLTFLLNIYPFSRIGQIKSSLEYTGRLIDRGFSILAFPEGRISLTGKLQPFKEGAGFLAVEMQVPIVPIKLIGSNYVYPPGRQLPHLPFRNKIIVKFGRPLKFSPETSYIEVTETIENAIRNL